MFPNLNAEQARRSLTDEKVAAALGLKRATYGRKKQNGRFLASECLALCQLFDCSFEYLFAADCKSA